MAFKPSTKMVIEYLQKNSTKDMTAAQVADDLGLDVKVVNGAFTQAIQKKKLGMRVEDTISTDEGTKVVKYLKLNEEGLALKLDAE